MSCKITPTRKPYRGLSKKVWFASKIEKHDEDHIKFKYVKELLEREEILEECIPRRHYLAKNVEVI